jgi:hypothetical protein
MLQALLLKWGQLYPCGQQQLQQQQQQGSTQWSAQEEHPG